MINFSADMATTYPNHTNTIKHIAIPVEEFVTLPKTITYAVELGGIQGTQEINITPPNALCLASFTHDAHKLYTANASYVSTYEPNTMYEIRQKSVLITETIARKLTLLHPIEHYLDIDIAYFHIQNEMGLLAFPDPTEPHAVNHLPKYNAKIGFNHIAYAAHTSSYTFKGYYDINYRGGRASCTQGKYDYHKITHYICPISVNMSMEEIQALRLTATL